MLRRAAPAALICSSSRRCQLKPGQPLPTTLMFSQFDSGGCYGLNPNAEVEPRMDTDKHG